MWRKRLIEDQLGFAGRGVGTESDAKPIFSNTIYNTYLIVCHSPLIIAAGTAVSGGFLAAAIILLQGLHLHGTILVGPRCPGHPQA